MYDYIRGRITELTPATAVVEVGGVGYSLIISLQTYTRLSGAEDAQVFVHFAVREDAQLFYGFATREERDIFRLLIGVSGVGGNTARMILSTFTASEVASVITTGQADVLKTVKGLGLKTAQKIIVELRDKIGVGTAGGTALPLQAPGGENFSEALSALTMLGFTRAASEKALKTLVRENPALPVEELIRLALKKM